MRSISLKQSKWISLLIGIALILTGVTFFVYPIEGTITIINWIGISLIVIGALKIIRYLTHRVFRTGGFLVSAFLDIILGIFILGHNITTINALVLLLGFWQLFSGISAIASAIDLRRVRLQRWWLGLIYGAIGIIFGYIIIKETEIGVLYISMLTGINMIMYGVLYISTFLVLDKLPKEIVEDISEMERVLDDKYKKGAQMSKEQQKREREEKERLKEQREWEKEQKEREKQKREWDKEEKQRIREEEQRIKQEKIDQVVKKETEENVFDNVKNTMDDFAVDSKDENIDKDELRKKGSEENIFDNVKNTMDEFTVDTHSNKIDTEKIIDDIEKDNRKD